MNGISLTIPFFNEEKVLQDTLQRTWSFLVSLNRPFELILADDGSTDRSGSIAEDFRKMHGERCRLLCNERNQGRGSMLSRAFAESNFPIVAYVDADLEIELPFVAELIAQFEDPGVMVVTGSKLKTPQHQLRARHRKLASLVFNQLVRWCLRSPVSDHQCGLKGFRRSVILELLPQVREKGWAWDTELLLLAQKRGYRVREFPVQLHSKRQSKVPLIPTVLMFSRKLFSFWRRGLSL